MTVILTLALGIAANSLVYSVVDSVVLNPFSYPDSHSLVGIGPIFPRLNRELNFWEVLSPAEYQDIERESRTLEKVVCWDMGNRQVSGGEVPENLFSAFWWGNAFGTLEVLPALGRGFTLEETVRGDPVAIISYRYWRRSYGGDQSIVGRIIHVNGNPYTVIGVMPRRTLIYGTDLWIPMGVAPERFPRGRRQFQVLARLASGKTLQDANTELGEIARRIEQIHGEEFTEYDGWRLVAETWNHINTRLLRSAAVIIAGAVGFVMLLVCANVASLFLVRTSGRAQEFAIRNTLGASRARILRQLLTESVIMSLLGGAAGLGLAALGAGWVGSTIIASPISLPGAVTLNTRVMVFTVALSVVVGLAIGLIPALKMIRSDVQTALQGEGRAATPGIGRQRLQSILVGVEVALAVLLLLGGGLLIRSFLRLQSVDPGLRTESVLTMRLTLPEEKYRGPGITSFFETLVARVESIPGVTRACAANQFPPRVFSNRQFQIGGRQPEREGRLPTVYATLITEDYFETLGIPIQRGRGIVERDRLDAPLVAVINDVAARRYFPNEDPIGQRIKIGPPDSDSPWLEIVGIAASTQNRGLHIPKQPEVFAGVRQVEGAWNQLFLLIRTEGNPRSVLGAVRKEVANLDPEQPIYAIRTLDEAFAETTIRQRLASTILSLFALFAMSLAGMGIFSVVSYRVSSRTREIGIRIALGATRAQVRRLVVRQALMPAILGASIGLISGLAMANLMKDLLFEVRGTDPVTSMLVIGILILVSYAATYVPAHRATKMDPMSALRHE